MDYPLQLRFKILGLAPQIYVTDSGGNSVFYVKQKLFKLKEKVNVFRDSSQSEQLYKMGADRILDFSAKYNFTDANDAPIGAVKRQGMRSIFKAHFDIYDGEDIVMTITEEAAWKRIVEALLGQIPIIGFFAIMFINPTYLVKRGDEVVLKLIKKPAFFEGKFDIERVVQLGEQDETRALLALLMMSLLERGRG